MGIRGAAVATVIAQHISGILILLLFPEQSSAVSGAQGGYDVEPGEYPADSSHCPVLPVCSSLS